MDKRACFDVEPGHGPTRPALRRITSPMEWSPAYLEVLSDSPMIASLACRIGQDLQLHHSKMNSKLPGAATVVKLHQNFTFDPHSNSDKVTCLLFHDDVTLENGPLMTAPGSYTGPLISLWQDGRSTGAISKEDTAGFKATAVPSFHASMMLQGADPGRIRPTSFKMEMPKIPRSSSFLEQQES